MKEYIVKIPGKPIGQARPRMTTIRGKPRVYDPKKSSDWKKFAAKIMALKATDGPIDVACGVVIRAYFNPPKGAKAYERHSPWRAKKPDIDNIIKIVLDAGNGVLWKDDNLVVSVEAVKFQTAQPESVTVIAQEIG